MDVDDPGTGNASEWPRPEPYHRRRRVA